MAVHDSSLRSLTPESKFLTHYYFNKCILSACHVPSTVQSSWFHGTFLLVRKFNNNKTYAVSGSKCYEEGKQSKVRGESDGGKAILCKVKGEQRPG